MALGVPASGCRALVHSAPDVFVASSQPSELSDSCAVSLVVGHGARNFAKRERPRIVSAYRFRRALGMRRFPLVPLVISALICAGMWSYASRVLVPQQKEYAASQGIPRGNLSDLYPRWLGSRELLLHGRDPYAADVTRDIQTGYYGRPLDPGRPNDPKDQQAFAYPLYVVLVLAPTVRFPFPLVQRAFLGLLLVLTASSVLLWLRALQWRISLTAKLLWIILVVGSFPAIQGFKLQQLTLLVAALLAAAMACLVQRRFVIAGILL